MGAAKGTQLRLGKLEGGKHNTKDGADVDSGAKKPVKGMTAPDASVAIPTMSGEPSTMHVNLQKHSLGTLEVGKKVKGTFEGHIKSHNHDGYGHHASVEIHHLGVGADKMDSGPRK